MAKESLQRRNKEIYELYNKMRQEMYESDLSERQMNDRFRKVVLEKYYIQSRMQIHRILKEARNGAT